MPRPSTRYSRPSANSTVARAWARLSKSSPKVRSASGALQQNQSIPPGRPQTDSVHHLTNSRLRRRNRKEGATGNPVRSPSVQRPNLARRLVCITIQPHRSRHLYLPLVPLNRAPSPASPAPPGTVRPSQCVPAVHHDRRYGPTLQRPTADPEEEFRHQHRSVIAWHARRQGCHQISDGRGNAIPYSPLWSSIIPLPRAVPMRVHGRRRPAASNEIAVVTGTAERRGEDHSGAGSSCRYDGAVVKSVLSQICRCLRRSRTIGSPIWPKW